MHYLISAWQDKDHNLYWMCQAEQNEYIYLIHSLFLVDKAHLSTTEAAWTYTSLGSLFLSKHLAEKQLQKILVFLSHSQAWKTVWTDGFSAALWRFTFALSVSGTHFEFKKSLLTVEVPICLNGCRFWVMRSEDHEKRLQNKCKIVIMHSWWLHTCMFAACAPYFHTVRFLCS